MNIWNTICSDLTNEKLRQATEKDYQSKVFTHFYYLLGWYSERVEQQYQQRVGSNVQYVYPDIVFFANNEKLFVIEMKQPNHIQTKEDIEQYEKMKKEVKNKQAEGLRAYFDVLKIEDERFSFKRVNELIDQLLITYEEKLQNSKLRLKTALEVICINYLANDLLTRSNMVMEQIEEKNIFGEQLN